MNVDGNLSSVGCRRLHLNHDLSETITFSLREEPPLFTLFPPGIPCFHLEFPVFPPGCIALYWVHVHKSNPNDCPKWLPGEATGRTSNYYGQGDALFRTPTTSLKDDVMDTVHPITCQIFKLGDCPGSLLTEEFKFNCICITLNH